MLNLPIYARSGVYYFHTRIAGRQFKRSLGTSNPLVAKLRALEFLKAAFMSDPKVSDFPFDPDRLRRYEIDLKNGVLKASDAQDHKLMMDALDRMGPIPGGWPKADAQPALGPQARGLKLFPLLDKFFLLKTHLKPATVAAYKNTITEFSGFLKNPMVQHVGVSDVTRYQEHLAGRANTSRTIDNKVATVRALMNFAIAQGYYFDKNPAQNRNLLTKKQKMAGGYAIFEEDEIEKLFSSASFKAEKTDDPDYYWAVVLGLVSGCRISEITSLHATHFKTSKAKTRYVKINDAKTLAGLRDVPLPDSLFAAGLDAFIEGKTAVFKYRTRDGKGSGNAVGKKFSRHLAELDLSREKLVFHSLRKFCNNFLLSQRVEYEPRCQFLGHEINSVNIQTYTNKLTVDDLAERVGAAQEKLVGLVGPA